MPASDVPNNVLWALHDRARSDRYAWGRSAPGWLITKTTPRAAVWGKSKHGAARVIHRIRFQVTATEQVGRPGVGLGGRLKPRTLTITVWRCGGKATDWRGIQIMPDPIASRRPQKERCHGCERPDK